MTSLVKCQCLSYSMHLCRLLLIYLHFELLYFNKFCCFVGIEQSFAVWKDLIKDPKFIRAMQFLDLIFIRITLWWNWFSFNLHFIFLALEWHRTKFFQSCQLSTPFESRIDSWFFWKKAHWINSSTLNYWVVATLMSFALLLFLVGLDRPDTYYSSGPQTSPPSPLSQSYPPFPSSSTRRRHPPDRLRVLKRSNLYK